MHARDLEDTRVSRVWLRAPIFHPVPYLSNSFLVLSPTRLATMGLAYHRVAISGGDLLLLCGDCYLRFFNFFFGIFVEITVVL